MLPSANTSVPTYVICFDGTELGIGVFEGSNDTKVPEDPEYPIDPQGPSPPEPSPSQNETTSAPGTQQQPGILALIERPSNGSDPKRNETNENLHCEKKHEHKNGCNSDHNCRWNKAGKKCAKKRTDTLLRTR